MSKVTGDMSVSCHVECPHCEELIDLFDITWLTEEGLLYKRIFEGERFGCKDLDEEINCPDCKVEFKVGEIVW